MLPWAALSRVIGPVQGLLSLRMTRDAAARLAMKVKSSSAQEPASSVIGVEVLRLAELAFANCRRMLGRNKTMILPATVQSGGSVSFVHRGAVWSVPVQSSHGAFRIDFQCDPIAMSSPSNLQTMPDGHTRIHRATAVIDNVHRLSSTASLSDAQSKAGHVDVDDRDLNTADASDDQLSKLLQSNVFNSGRWLKSAS